jgi:hypothetical protein
MWRAIAKSTDQLGSIAPDWNCANDVGERAWRDSKRRSDDAARDRWAAEPQCGLIASSESSAFEGRMELTSERRSIRSLVPKGTYKRLAQCYYLEDAATEFQIQGLEVDLGVACPAMRTSGLKAGAGSTMPSGATSGSGKQATRQRYLLECVSVLLTRARQGMVIFVPPGDADDLTRAPSFYDETYSYLKTLGVSDC